MIRVFFSASRFWLNSDQSSPGPRLLRRKNVSSFTRLCPEVWTHGSIGKSWREECGRPGRRAGFKGIAGLAALVPEMPQNAVYNPGLGNDGDGPHLGAARAQERVDFIEELP